MPEKKARSTMPLRSDSKEQANHSLVVTLLQADCIPDRFGPLMLQGSRSFRDAHEMRK
jgi:hypothetical protein